MTRTELNAQIASYTIKNANYMRNGGVNNGSYNCNIVKGNIYSFKSYLGIPSNENILSFFDIGIFIIRRKKDLHSQKMEFMVAIDSEIDIIIYTRIIILLMNHTVDSAMQMFRT